MLEKLYVCSTGIQNNHKIELCSSRVINVSFREPISQLQHLSTRNNNRKRCRLHLFQIRPSTDQDSFLIHPFGLLYSEVTASSLQKINPDGSVVDQGSTNLGVNKAGILLHSAIHGARKDARAVIHLHQEDTVAVSLHL